MEIQNWCPNGSGGRFGTQAPSGWDVGPTPVSHQVRMQIQHPCPIRLGSRSGIQVLEGWDADPEPVSQWVRMQVWYQCPMRWGCRSNICIPSRQDADPAPVSHQNWDAGPAPDVPWSGTHDLVGQDEGLVPKPRQAGMQIQNLCPVRWG